MDGIRFILEDPQAAGSRQKKRSRLVTACDTCRTKKIKCHQSSTSSKCEACRLSKTPCRFRDRERYHAQRSGSLSATSSSFPSDSEDAASITDSPGITARRATLPVFSQYQSNHARSSSLPPAASRISKITAGGAKHIGGGSGRTGPQRAQRSPTNRRPGLVSSASDNGISRHSTPSLSIASTSSYSPSPLGHFQDLVRDDHADLPLLFDPLRPMLPSSKYMEHGVDLFFDHFGSRFLFLHHDLVRRCVVDHTFPPTLANCIVSLALRFSPSAEIAAAPRVHVGDSYLEMAKDLLMPLIYTPAIETLHSLLIMAWCEYGSGREQGLVLHTALAVQMALDLHLGSEEIVQSAASEQERADIRQTWWNVVLMDIIASWVSGVPSVLNLMASTTAPPESYFQGGDSTVTPLLPYSCLYELLNIRDCLLPIMNLGYRNDINIHIDAEAELRDIRTRLYNIQMSLPASLESNIQNLQRSFQDKLDSVFIFLHLILNSLNAMSHCPSLFRSLQNQIPEINENVSLAARNIVDVVAMIESVDARAISAIPFLDFPLGVAARVFALESHLEKSPASSELELSQLSKGHLSEISLGVCNSILSRLAEYWGNVRTMEMHIQAGTMWTFICPVRQSPVAVPSALGLDNVGIFQGNVPMPSGRIGQQHDQQDSALTYSDSDLSREASPMLFDFPLLIDTAQRSNQLRIHHDGQGNLRDTSGMQLRQASSDPTPTTMLPPVSLASGGVSSYEDYVNYVAPFSEGSSPQTHDYFAMSHINGDCLSTFNTDGNQGARMQSPYPPSPWLSS